MPEYDQVITAIIVHVARGRPRCLGKVGRHIPERIAAARQDEFAFRKEEAGTPGGIEVSRYN